MPVIELYKINLTWQKVLLYKATPFIPYSKLNLKEGTSMKVTQFILKELYTG